MKRKMRLFFAIQQLLRVVLHNIFDDKPFYITKIYTFSTTCVIITDQQRFNKGYEMTLCILKDPIFIFVQMR